MANNSLEWHCIATNISLYEEPSRQLLSMTFLCRSKKPRMRLTRLCETAKKRMTTWRLLKGRTKFPGLTNLLFELVSTPGVETLLTCLERGHDDTLSLSPPNRESLRKTPSCASCAHGALCLLRGSLRRCPERIWSPPRTMPCHGRLEFVGVADSAASASRLC